MLPTLLAYKGTTTSFYVSVHVFGNIIDVHSMKRTFARSSAHPSGMRR